MVCTAFTSILRRVPLAHWLRISLFLLAVLIVTSSLHVAAQSANIASPHIANRAYSPDQVMRVQGVMNHSNGAPQKHSSVVVHQGYVVQAYSSGNANPEAGIAVYDLSNPAAPQLVSQTKADRFSEQHAIAFTEFDGHTYTAHLAVDGIEIWDWTEMSSPRPVSHLKLDGIQPGYSHGAWWLSWQAPYLYVSGAANGIYIVDTTDITQPRLIDRKDAPNPVPTSQTGGFRVGSIFAVGNLLVASANDGRGVATLDISDPRNPTLLTARVNDAPSSYSSMLNGNHLYAAGTDDQLHGFDLSDPFQLRYVGAVALAGRGGYLTIQDNFAHVGASGHYIKVDISRDGDYRTVGSASSNVKDADEDFVVAVGNLVVVSDDHDNGSFIVPHQAEADEQGPVVNMVVPQAEAANQSRATRIGLTFTDMIDLSSVNNETFIVRPLAGDALTGRYSTQTGIVNFSPDQPLEPDTTYEIIIPAGGIRDVMGNSTPTTFQSTFATGESVGKSFWCTIDPPPATLAGEPVNLRLHVTEAPVGSTLRWDFGDGSPIVDSAFTTVTSHRYAAPGRYRVRATVGAHAGATACSTEVTVYAPPTAGPAPNSSTIILDRSGTQIWNVNPDNNSVSVINAVLLKKMGEIPVGRHPRTLAQAPDGTVWTVNQDDATITVIDANTRSVLTIISLPRGSEPYGIVFSPRQTSAYVSLQATGQVAELDASRRTLIRTLDVGPTPRALALSADGQRLFVTRFLSIAPQDAAQGMGQGEVIEVDPLLWQVRRTIPLAYDLGPDTEASGRGVPNGLAAATISPAGDQLWIGARKSNTTRGELRDGNALTYESTVRSMLATIDLNTNQEEIANRYDFNNRDGPVAIRFSPLGDTIFVLLEGVNAVDILDAYTHQLVTSIDNVGHAPQGLVFTADGSKLFVHSWLTRSVFVYDVSQLLNRDAASPRLLSEIGTVADDQTPPQVLEGKQIFYNAADPRMSRDDYLSCASCHFDSREDGQVWDRSAEGEGLRNTMTLLGKGSDGHGLIHWSGNFDEVQDFEHDIRDNFGGQGFMSDELFNQGTRNIPLGDSKAGLSAELDALAAYVDSLRSLPPSPYRAPDGNLTPEGQAGREIFMAEGCAACHGGPQFTDSPTGMMHNVGTLNVTSGNRLGKSLFGLDTPTLRGLWLTAPYLHDGSAPTLNALLTTRNPLDLHAELQPFIEEDPRAVEQLVAYMLQIDGNEPAFDEASLAVEMVKPAANTQVKVNQPVDLAANTASVYGPVVRVQFYVNDLLLGEDTTAIYTWRWMPTEVGHYLLRARLTYDNGTSTVSPPHPVEVVP